MDKHISGWISEKELMEFLTSSTSLEEVFAAVSVIKDRDQLDSIVKFLENAARHHTIANKFMERSLRTYLITAVKSPSERLHALVMEAVTNSTVPDLDMELLTILLRDQDTGIGQKAEKVIIAHSTNSTLTHLIEYYNSPSTRLNETEQFRFIELFINLGKKSNIFFEKIKSEKIFNFIIDSFLHNENDLLVKLGSLTLIESLASYSMGREFLADSNILLQLESELTGPLADSTTVITLMYSISGIIPFVRDRGVSTGLVLSRSGRIQKILDEFIVSTNNAERMCAFKFLGQLSAAATVAGIDEFLTRNWKLLNQILFALSDIDVEVVNSALDVIHMTLKEWEKNPFMESETCQNELVTAVLETFKRHPFPECRCLVYSVLGAILANDELTRSSLGRILAEPSPIRSALLDYKSEASYECRRAKCDFVRVLVRSEDKGILSKYFNKEQVENFIDFAEKGLEWVPITVGKDELQTEAL